MRLEKIELIKLNEKLAAELEVSLHVYEFKCNAVKI